MNQTELLEQIESARERLNMEPVHLRRLAHDVVPGVQYPVRDISDLNCSQLQFLLNVIEALERSAVQRWQREKEMVNG